MQLTRNQALEIAGYAGFFCVAFVMCAYWSFPYERIADQYVQKFAAERGYRIEIGDVDPYWLTGVEVEDVHMYTSPEDEVGIRMLEAQARAGLFSLLGDSTDLSFGAEFATGSLDGSFLRNEEAAVIEAELDNVRLEMLPMLSGALGLPIAGAASGTIDLMLTNDPSQSEGEVDLQVKNFRVGDGKAKLSIPGVPSLTVDPVEAGDLTLKLKVEDGVATLQDLQTKGKDLELEAGGEMRLGKSITTSRPNFALRARFTDAYKTKTPRTEAMFSLLENSNSRQIKRAMDKDGWLNFTMTGSLSNPRFVPGARSGPSRGPARTPKGAAGVIRARDIRKARRPRK